MIDVIDHDNFGYDTQAGDAMRGAFDWEMYYKRIPIPAEMQREDASEPFEWVFNRLLCKALLSSMETPKKHDFHKCRDDKYQHFYNLWFLNWQFVSRRCDGAVDSSSSWIVVGVHTFQQPSRVCAPG